MVGCRINNHATSPIFISSVKNCKVTQQWNWGQGQMPYSRLGSNSPRSNYGQNMVGLGIRTVENGFECKNLSLIFQCLPNCLITGDMAWNICILRVIFSVFSFAEHSLSHKQTNGAKWTSNLNMKGHSKQYSKLYYSWFLVKQTLKYKRSTQK